MSQDGNYQISSLERSDIYEVSRTVARLIEDKVSLYNEKARKGAEKQVDILLKKDEYYQKLLITVQSLKENVDLLNTTIEAIFKSYEEKTSRRLGYYDMNLHYNLRDLANNYRDHKVDEMLENKYAGANVRYLSDVIQSDMTLVNSAVTHPSFPNNIEDLVTYYWNKFVTIGDKPSEINVLDTDWDSDWDDDEWDDLEDLD